MSDRTTCILVDGSSFFYRAFHALPPLINSKGQPTGAIYGVANMVKKLIAQQKPKFIGVIFDAPGKTFREDIYPQYKAHRPPTPNDLKVQYEPLVNLLIAMGIKVYAIPGVEADDVIGTLAKEAAKKNIPVCIATGDKDFAQMVDSHVCLYNSMSETWLNEEGIEAKYGIKPHQFIDYLTLTGDSVDNIPGVPKCGPKTASKWLQTYGSLENLQTHADEVSGKIGEQLRAHLHLFPMTKQLVTIKSDLSLNFGLEDLIPSPISPTHLFDLAAELEFKSWLKEKPKQVLESSPVSIISTTTELDAWLKQLNRNDPLVIDTETTSLQSLDAKLVGISMCSHLDNIIYIPIAHHVGENIPLAQVLKLIKPYLIDEQIKKVGQNLKYDVNVFKNVGIHLQGIYSDTMLESYVFNSTSNRHDLATLAKNYLHQDSISYEDVTGKGSKQIPFADVSIERAAEYSGEDARLTLQLHQYFPPRLSTKEQELLYHIEMPLLSILAQMERIGVRINARLLEEQSILLKEKLHHLEQNAWLLAGTPFNLQSPKQLATIFYDKMQLPILAKTPGGQPSTAEDVLQQLAQDYELPACILEHRRLSKLVSTYLDALPKRIHPETHRVHTSYNQAITSTGRLSSSEPNLQNIPIRTSEGRMIRQAFIAKDNYVLVTADYSQVELRIMAHLSEDPKLIQAFQNNHDIHQATASELFGTPMDKITQDERRKAKTINFGLIYGMSAFGLAKQLDLSRDEAQNYINRYFERYQGVSKYMTDIKKLAHQNGYVETLLGRRLYLNEINSKNVARMKGAERMAINAPMQGTAAELIKKAMISIDTWLKSNPQIRADMTMQVHDELVFEVHLDDVQVFMSNLKYAMEHALVLRVPLMVNIGQGLNWEEAH